MLFTKAGLKHSRMFVALPKVVWHTTGSVGLVTLLNNFGHGISAAVTTVPTVMCKQVSLTLFRLL